MKSATASLGANDKPSVVWSLVAKNCEEIFSKTLWCPETPSGAFSDNQIHFLDKGPVKKVQWTLVLIIIHVFHVSFQGPINSFSSKFEFAIVFYEIFAGPIF